MNAARGVTLVELMVTLVILSTLAMVAQPYVEQIVRREREVELRRALREVRGAIDRFHDDWRQGRMVKAAEVVSDDGYPRSLAVLVDGVERTGARGARLRYLRRIPRDPFGDASLPPERQWQVRGYQDDPKGLVWSAADVYDLHSGSAREGSDGVPYKDW